MENKNQLTEHHHLMHDARRKLHCGVSLKLRERETEDFQRTKLEEGTDVVIIEEGAPREGKHAAKQKQPAETKGRKDGMKPQ